MNDESENNPKNILNILFEPPKVPDSAEQSLSDIKDELLTKFLRGKGKKDLLNVQISMILNMGQTLESHLFMSLRFQTQTSIFKIFKKYLKEQIQNYRLRSLIDNRSNIMREVFFEIDPSTVH